MSIKKIWILCLFCVLIPCLLSGSPKCDKPGKSLRTTQSDTNRFDGNSIACWMENNGQIVSHKITGRGGMEWPKGSGKTIDYASGLWILGKVGRDIRSASVEYSSEFRPGEILSDGSAADPDDPAYRIYKIDRDGSGDWDCWPFDQGAPGLRAADGKDSLDSQGNRIPLLLGDQTLWWVMNDLDVEPHRNVFDTDPIGIEARLTIFGFGDPYLYFNNMMFIKWKLINKSANDVRECHIVLWDDCDLGDATDDKAGCDTTIHLGYGYNEGSDHQYGDNPPAIGFLLLQGPVVPSAMDTARAFDRMIPGYKNLGMTAFIGGG